MTVDFYKPGYDKKVRQFAALQRKDLGLVVRDEARLALLECIDRTPPMDGKRLKGRGYAAGRAAVRRDIEKLMRDPRQLNLYRNVPGFRKAVDAGDVANVRKFLPNASVIAMEPDYHFHQSRRDSRGRVRRGPSHQVVLAAGAVAKYLKRIQEEIGYARSGWVPAARRFGAKLDNWVSKHPGQGMVSDRTHGTETPIAEAGNLVRYILNRGRLLGIVKAALRSREKSLEIKIRKLTDRSFLQSNV